MKYKEIIRWSAIVLSNVGISLITILLLHLMLQEQRQKQNMDMWLVGILSVGCHFVFMAAGSEFVKFCFEPKNPMANLEDGIREVDITNRYFYDCFKVGLPIAAVMIPGYFIFF